MVKELFKIKGEVKWRHFFRDNKKDNPISHLSIEQQEGLRYKLFEIISSIRSLKIISVVSTIIKMQDKTEEEIYHDAYKSIVERFQYFLQDIKKDTGQSNRGLIIVDNRNHHQDKKLKLFHHQLVKTYNHKFIIENVFIGDSDLSTGLQLSELACGAMTRKYTKNDDKFFKLILDNIRCCNKTGKIEGFGTVERPKK